MSEFEAILDPVMHCHITDLGNIKGVVFSFDDKARRIEVASDDELNALRVECRVQGVVEVLSLVDAEQSRRARNRQHGEGMLASAHANRRANQALSVGVGALILALIAILCDDN